MLSARRAVGALPTADAAVAATTIGSVPDPGAPGAGSSTETGAARHPATTVSPATTDAPNAMPSPGLATSSPPAGVPVAQTPATAGRIGGFILAVGIAALIAAGAGVWLGGVGANSRASFGDSASAGNIELSFPSSWRRIAAPAAIPGLPLSNTIALAPREAAIGQRLLAGGVSAPMRATSSHAGSGVESRS